VLACATFLDTQPDGQLLAVCGSIPGWTTNALAPLRDAFARWARRGRLVADTYGPPLAWFAAQPLALLKINADELRAFPGSDLADTSAALARARATSPVQRWVISDGPRAVWWAESDAPAVSIEPPPVVEISATGSGDVLLACLIDALFRRGRPLAEAVANALPYASANAAHPGIAEFPEPV
jgi:fructose-1-phosphate kinase PfkB-like protein